MGTVLFGVFLENGYNGAFIVKRYNGGINRENGIPAVVSTVKTVKVLSWWIAVLLRWYVFGHTPVTVSLGVLARAAVVDNNNNGHSASIFFSWE